MASDKRLAIIGAPLDLGAGRRGVDMGPSAIRYAGLEARLAGLGLETDDRGNVQLVDVGPYDHDQVVVATLPLIRQWFDELAGSER